MNAPISKTTLRALTAVAATLMLLALTAGPGSADTERSVADLRAEAYRLYDEANYGESLPLLRRIEAASAGRRRRR